MNVPQKISFVTLGAQDMRRLRTFYLGLGWSERPGSNENFTAFDMGATRLALYPLGLLGAEAAPGEPLPKSGWNGITLAVNVDDMAAVDRAFRAAVSAGAVPIAEPVKREWGGYSGYIADPEGNRWEIAWAPES